MGVRATAILPSRASAAPLDAGDAAERAAIEAERRGDFGRPDLPAVHARLLAALAGVASPWRTRPDGPAPCYAGPVGCSARERFAK